MSRLPLFRPGRGGVLKPQHRMVLGLFAMSLGVFVMSVLHGGPDEEGPGGEGSPVGAGAPEARPAAPPTPGTTPGSRAAVPLPAERPAPPGAADPAAIAQAMEAATPGVNACAADPAAFAPVDGRLVLVLTLDAQGLASAHVDALPALSDPAAACLGGALGRVAWPLAAPPVRIRLPFYVVQP